MDSDPHKRLSDLLQQSAASEDDAIDAADWETAVTGEIRQLIGRGDTVLLDQLVAMSPWRCFINC